MDKTTNYFDNLAAARDQYKKDTDNEGEGLVRNTLEKSYAKPVPDGDYEDFDEAYDAGYEAGFDQGQEEGYAEGHSEGYTEGYDDARGEYETID